MQIKTTRGRLLASSMIMGAAAFTLATGASTTASAAAASASAGSDNSNEVTEVVITGSRIKGNTESPSPISVSTQAEIQLTKAESVEDVLSRMTGPDFSNGGLSSASNNGGVGLSEVGLRGLGPTRTLVLIDGQRLIPVFSGATSVPDLNSVPLSMVDRIEVLRDGASSIYGADAVGGVINIITKKHASGMTLDGSLGTSQHGGGTQYSVTGTLGMNSDRGNLLVAVGWDHTDQIEQAQRAWSVNPYLGVAGKESGSTYRGQINLLQDENSNAVWANDTQYDITNPIVATLAPNLVYMPGAGVTKLNAGAPGWNWLTGELDRKQISFTGHYNITDNITAVAEGFYTNRTSAQSLRPEPLLGDSIATTVNGNPVFAGFIVPSFAPHNTTGQDIFAFLTPDQFGPRRYNQESQTYRIRFGLEGTIAGKYDWEFGYVTQENSDTNIVHNEGNFEHLAELTGQIGCVSAPGGCVPNTLPNTDPHSLHPLNPLPYLPNGGPAMLPAQMPDFFNGPNMFTPAQIAYLTFDNTDRNKASERYFYANIGGPLFDLPAGTIKGNVGFEYRTEHLSDTPDILVQEGWAPNQSNPTDGGYNVTSIFGEAYVPLLKDAPFAKSLTLTPSIRYDHYSNFGDSTTGKFGVDWAVNDDIRVRGSYWTGFRAPSTAELFGGQLISDISASGDPCDTRLGVNGNANAGTGLTGTSHPGSTCAVALTGKTGSNIAFSGTSLVSFNSSNNITANNQEQVLIGGNPNLKPEIARGWGAGIVLTPHFVPGFSFDVDYYHTELSNTILTGGIAGVSGPDLILNGCYGAAQNQTYCALIHRNGQGTITQIDSLNTNFGVAVVEGVDFEWIFDTGRQHWDLPTVGGSLRADLQLSYLIHNSQSAPDGSVANYPGTFVYANEGINPRWKGVLNLDWKRDAWTVHWDTRYFESMISLERGGGVGNQVPNMWYNDLSVSYNFAKLGPANNARLTLGIDNLFDQDPPFVKNDSICKCNSLAGAYDFVGRFFYGRISTSF